MTDRLPVPTSLRWRKSSHSNNAAGCVELAILGQAMAVRDSKHQTGPVLTFTASSFRTFLTTVAY